MSESLIINLLINQFNVNPRVQVENGKRVIIFSEEVPNLEQSYDKFYALEAYLNYHGYSVLTQDDPDYFGAQLTPF